MSYTDVPNSVRSLEQRIRNLEGSEELAIRRRVGMALVVVGQMLPEGAIKGGSAMALRYGRGTRFTQDLDAARVQPLAWFRSDFEDSLAVGWAGFTGRLIEKAAPRPAGVPTAYVMQPFDVKLDYRGRPWCTVKFELGHNEIGDAHEPEYQLADGLAQLFTEVGLETPKPVPVMRVDHQIAQKLHAVSDLAASECATSSTSNCSTTARTWTSPRSTRPASGCSSTGANRPGHRRSRSSMVGATCTRRPSRTWMFSATSKLRSRGATTSSRGSPKRERPGYGGAVTTSAEEVLRLALALPAAACLRLAIRLIESLEVVPDSGKSPERES